MLFTNKKMIQEIYDRLKQEYSLCQIPCNNQFYVDLDNGMKVSIAIPIHETCVESIVLMDQKPIPSTLKKHCTVDEVIRQLDSLTRPFLHTVITKC